MDFHLRTRIFSGPSPLLHFPTLTKDRETAPPLPSSVCARLRMQNFSLQSASLVQLRIGLTKQWQLLLFGMLAPLARSF